MMSLEEAMKMKALLRYFGGRPNLAAPGIKFSRYDHSESERVLG